MGLKSAKPVIGTARLIAATTRRSAAATTAAIVAPEEFHEQQGIQQQVFKGCHIDGRHYEIGPFV